MEQSRNELARSVTLSNIPQLAEVFYGLIGQCHFCQGIDHWPCIKVEFHQE